MRNNQSLSHTKWDYKYHVVWIPKCRRKAMYGDIRGYLGETFHDLARQRECKIIEGHIPVFSNPRPVKVAMQSFIKAISYLS